MFGVFTVGPLCWLSIYTIPNPQLDPELRPTSMLSFSSYRYWEFLLEFPWDLERST
jgi:hypothetical protein